jgi:uncharacterized membrane protein YedE/YeeE
MNILLAILLGGFFGFALYYSGASKPGKIINMLALKELTIMKVIVFAIGVASLLIALSSFIGIFDITHFSIKTTHLGVLIGGLIFGIGFGWAGSCPGTCVAGSSSGGFRKAIVVILGGLIGALAFSLSYGFLAELGLFKTMNLGKLTLFSISEKFPSVLPIGMSGLMLLGIVLIAIGVIIPAVPFKEEKFKV